jgi:hypothetical protein
MWYCLIQLPLALAGGINLYDALLLALAKINEESFG